MMVEKLQEWVQGWETLGHVPTLHHFVLRNGRSFKPAPRVGRKGKAKECFRNASQHVIQNGGWYVEGFIMIYGLPILHAWVSPDGSSAMDPTLNSAEHEYFGVAFDKETLLEQLLRNKYYGLLDTGRGLNLEFMLQRDPGLGKIISKTHLTSVTKPI